jgi:hypothetical protein
MVNAKQIAAKLFVKTMAYILNAKPTERTARITASLANNWQTRAEMVFPNMEPSNSAQQLISSSM